MEHVISFPGLGLEFTLNRVAVNLFGKDIYWYGIIICIGFILAALYVNARVKEFGVTSDNLVDCLIICVPVGIICARIYYVIFEWDYYSQHPSEIIAIWNGGIAIYGAIIGGFITLVVFCRQRHLKLWTMLDVISPTLIMAQGIGRWGNFMNQEAFGGVTSRAALVAQHIPAWIINQMNIGGAYRVPTFLYESLWDLSGFVLLMLLRHRPHLFKQGEVFLTYVIWYAAGRFVIEGLRTDSLMLGPIRISQLLSVLFLVAALVVMVARRRTKKLAWYWTSK